MAINSGETNTWYTKHYTTKYNSSPSRYSQFAIIVQKKEMPSSGVLTEKCF